MPVSDNVLCDEYVSGLSSCDLEDKYNISRGVIKHILKKNGVLRTRSEAATVRSYSGKMDNAIKNLIHASKTTNRFNPLKSHKKEDHPCWLVDGSIVTAHHGKYKKIKIDGKWFYLHRYIAEKKIGRPLLSSESVHHIDCDCDNNDPSNLLVMTQKEHLTLHNVNTNDVMRELIRENIVVFDVNLRRYKVNASKIA